MMVLTYEVMIYMCFFEADIYVCLYVCKKRQCVFTLMFD